MPHGGAPPSMASVRGSIRTITRRSTGSSRLRPISSTFYEVIVASPDGEVKRLIALTEPAVEEASM
jgi:hypothetical protein